MSHDKRDISVNNDKVKISEEISEQKKQEEFFTNNLDQQFRSYYISKGSSSANYYTSWMIRMKLQ